MAYSYTNKNAALQDFDREYGNGKVAYNRFSGRTSVDNRDRAPRVLNLNLANNQGTPINVDIAAELRQVVFGQCPATTRSENFAQGPGLVFRDHGYPLAYGLMLTNPTATPIMRAMIMAIQAHVLRVLLFDASVLKLPKTCTPIMPTTVMIQQDTLAYALAHLIWKVGNGHSATLCLPHPTTVHVTSSPQFNEDGLTERILLCQMYRFEELHQTIRRNIHVFQEDPGPALMLVVYSCILTRGIDQVRKDLGKPNGGDGVLTPVKCVIGNSGNIVFSPISLFLLGNASPYLHNGVIIQEDSRGGQVEESGVLIRSPIGLLVWMGTEDKTASCNVGSRYKTPIVPIWVVICGEQSGVLFSDDKGLLRDYQAENRFQLQYYTSSFHQQNPAMLKINNRVRDEMSDVPCPPLERIIRTKWSDARVDWCGTEPFV